MGPSEAFKMLKEGNERFVREEPLHPRRDIETRQKLVHEQRPAAVILSCADSRVSPDIFFDQGIGDLFIIKVAGNVLGNLELETLKFAILVLNTPLIVVLGHENCGAVEAVITNNTSIIPEIAKQIERHCSSPDLSECIKQNVKGTVEDIEKDQQIAPLLKKGAVGIAGGYYELATGRVSFLVSSL